MNVHAVTPPAMVAAVDAGVTRLVHRPNKDFTSYEQAEKVAQTGSIVAGLIAFRAPNIDRLSTAPAAVLWPKDNQIRFRDGRPWPEAIAGTNEVHFLIDRYVEQSPISRHWIRQKVLFNDGSIQWIRRCRC